MLLDQSENSSIFERTWHSGNADSSENRDTVSVSKTEASITVEVARVNDFFQPKITNMPNKEGLS